MELNEKLDLVFARKTNLTPENLWRAWTEPDLLKKWFCPKPWKVADCRITLTPGGEFFTRMEGPDGQANDNSGCYLDVKTNEKLVWTNMMISDFRPVSLDGIGFPLVVTVTFKATPDGTLYRAVASHSNEEDRIKHESMGFQEGWGLAFLQLVELMAPKD